MLQYEKKLATIAIKESVMATVTQSRRGMSRMLMTLILVVPALAVVFWDEILLAGPIIFLVEWLGFWAGYIVFCLIWAGFGIFTLAVWQQLGPWVTKNIFRKEGETSTQDPEKGISKTWRGRIVLWFGQLTRAAGALAAVVLLGPVFAWSAFKVLGYSERQVYGFTIVGAFVFGAVWVPVYAGIWNIGFNTIN